VPEPLIFVTTATFDPDDREAVEQLSARLVDVAESHGSGLVAYHFHVSDDGESVTNVQVHADAASMDAYLVAAQDQIGQAIELTSIATIDVYGRPGPLLQQALEHNAAQGVEVRVVPTHLVGVTPGLAA
jgi:quinol monooxygenase YgiN